MRSLPRFTVGLEVEISALRFSEALEEEFGQNVYDVLAYESEPVIFEVLHKHLPSWCFPANRETDHIFEFQTSPFPWDEAIVRYIELADLLGWEQWEGTNDMFGESAHLTLAFADSPPTTGRNLWKRVIFALPHYAREDRFRENVAEYDGLAAFDYKAALIDGSKGSFVTWNLLDPCPRIEIRGNENWAPIVPIMLEVFWRATGCTPGRDLFPDDRSLNNAYRLVASMLRATASVNGGKVDELWEYVKATPLYHSFISRFEAWVLSNRRTFPKPWGWMFEMTLDALHDNATPKRVHEEAKTILGVK